MISDLPSPLFSKSSRILFIPVVLLLLTRILRYLTTAHTIFLLVVVFSLYIIYELSIKRRSLPPGPTPWLALGNMVPFIMNDFDSIMAHWRRVYGGIYTVWIGPFPLVLVNDITIMKRYFVQHGDVFSDRWRNFITDTFMGGENGIIQIDGEKWREQRRFSLRVLRDFGVGRVSMEKKILGEVRNFVTYLRGETCLDMNTSIAVCVGNIINDMLFGVTFPQGSQEMKRMHELLDAQSKLVVNPIMGLYIALPFTTKIPILNTKWKEVMYQRDNLWNFIQKQVKEHREIFQSGHRDADDFTFAYMMEMEKREMKGEDNSYFTEWQLTMLLLDLFFAGMETTVTTLKWAVLMMILHPEVKETIQQELDCVNSEEIRLSDKCSTPYTVAAINEIQRIANILPFNLLRTVSETVEIDGFTFKEGTMVIPQISTLLNDETVFEDPYEFRPSRFLNSDGKPVRYDEFIPFSIGRRQCLGESLARAELYLIFANLLKNFDISPVEGETYSRHRELGLTVSPPHYRVNIEERRRDANMNKC